MTRNDKIRMTKAGVKVAYQCGCYSIYRQYGNASVSTGSRIRWLDSHYRVLDKAVAALNASERMKPNYRQSLALSYSRRCEITLILIGKNITMRCEKSSRWIQNFNPANQPFTAS